MIFTKDGRKDPRSPIPAMLICTVIMLGVGIWHDFYHPRPECATIDDMSRLVNGH